MAPVRGKEKELGGAVFQWPKSGHLERMAQSGCFRFTREFSVHHHDRGNAERLVAVLLSQGGTAGLLRRGVSETKLGINHFCALCTEQLGEMEPPWLWTSEVQIGLV
jgi:hypothetical protein